MPKHLIKRYLPSPDRIIAMPGMQRFAPHLSDPRLWHLNRRSVVGAMYWGLFCAFLPLPFQFLPAALGAIFFRANLPLCIGLVWLSNPLTTIPILYVAYALGSTILGMPMLEIRQIGQLFGQFIRWVMQTGPNPFVSTSNAMFLWPLILGLLLEAILVSIIGGITTNLLWRRMVIRHWRQRQQQRAQSAHQSKDP
jgi:uncharacterized protein (DUF2062 family)